MKSMLDFLGEVIKLLNLQISKTDSNKDREKVEDVKDAYKWLISEINNTKSTRVQLISNPYLEPGKIYVFNYDPLYKNELDYWDAHPIVLSLGGIKGVEGVNCLGINISWYPPSARKYLIEKIRELYRPKFDLAISRDPHKAKNQRPIELDVKSLKMALDHLGFSFALRQYIPSRIKNPVMCICYEDWDKAVRLDQPYIFPEIQINNPKFNLRNIYEAFKLHLISKQEKKIKR